MKGLWGVCLLAVVAFAFSGVGLYRQQRESHWGIKTLEHIRQVKEDFQRRNTPIVVLSFSDLTPFPELLKSESTLPQYHRFPLNDLRQILEYSTVCIGRLPKKNDRLRKTRLWHSFLCGGVKLPVSFFSTPPFLHPSGKSFAQLAVESKRSEFQSPTWLTENEKYFHALELKERHRLSFLDFELLEGIDRMDSTLLGRQAVGLRRPANEKRPGDFFQIFERSKWDERLREEGFISAEFTVGQDCLFREGRVCWAFHTDRKKAEQAFLILLVLSGFTGLGASVYLFLDKRRTAIRVKEARHFLLQTLTHELRTPVTTLQLTVEAFRREFDQLPPNSQKHFLRLADEVQRLGRLVQTSVKYLRADSNDLRMEPQPISSLNQALSSWLLPYKDLVTFTPAEKDHSLKIDPYWFSLCLLNLVENSIRHGKGPILVQWEAKDGVIKLSVTDSGNPTFLRLEEFLTMERKADLSRGLGLGLSIVKRVMEKMGGALNFTPSPTRFSLVLRNMSYGDTTSS